VLVGHNSSLNDFSDVHFPSFPNFTSAMPKDSGDLGEKALEDTMRKGVTNCAKCHGDPDGDGPLQAPAQGDLHKLQPGKHSCGSCHDDLDYAKNYTSNGTTMPANIGDTAACNGCHPAAGSALAVHDAHIHPLKNPVLDPGLVVQMLDVTAARAPAAARGRQPDRRSRYGTLGRRRRARDLRRGQRAGRWPNGGRRRSLAVRCGLDRSQPVRLRRRLASASSSGKGTWASRCTAPGGRGDDHGRVLLRNRLQRDRNGQR
jgi:hypothetical protein